MKCHDVRLDTAMGMINTLKKAQLDGNLIKKMKQYTSPELLILDELGYILHRAMADWLRKHTNHLQSVRRHTYVREGNQQVP